jgi:hypothetical protein
MFLEIGILFKHAKLDDVMNQVCGIHQTQQLLRFNANLLQVRKDHLRGVSLLLPLNVICEHQRLKEKPNSMREENVGL